MKRLNLEVDIYREAGAFFTCGELSREAEFTEAFDQAVAEN